MVIREDKARNGAGNPDAEPIGSKVSEIAAADDSANDEIRSMVVGGPDGTEDKPVTIQNGQGQGQRQDENQGENQGEGDGPPEDTPAADRSLLPDVASQLNVGGGRKTAIDAMRTQGATPEAVDALADVVERFTDSLKSALNPNE